MIADDYGRLGGWGKSNFVVVFWWDVGKGKVKVEVKKRRGKEGQVGVGEGLDRRRWWGGQLGSR